MNMLPSSGKNQNTFISLQSQLCFTKRNEDVALRKQIIRDETKMKCVMFVVIGPHQSSDICTGPGGVTQYGFRDSEEIKINCVFNSTYLYSI